MYSLVMLDALEEGRVLFPLVGQEGMHLLSQQLHLFLVTTARLFHQVVYTNVNVFQLFIVRLCYRLPEFVVHLEEQSEILA